MSRARPTDCRHLAMDDIDDHPELAALTIVRRALPVIANALLAAHPHLVGDDIADPAEDAANVVLHASDTLVAALDAYHRIITTADTDPTKDDREPRF